MVYIVKYIQRGELLKKRRRNAKLDKFRYMLLLGIIFIGIFATINYFKYDILKAYKISYRGMYGKYLSDSKIENLIEDIDINEIEYDWAEELEYNNKPTQIIYHHSASSSKSPESIHEYHKNNGWSGIGYHYYITKDGVIYNGRPENAEGAHTKGQNKNSIGICLEGNFEDEEITLEQSQSLYEISMYIALKYDIYKIIGHGDAGQTLCPGKNFDVEKMKDSVINGVKNYNVDRNKLKSNFNILE